MLSFGVCRLTVITVFALTLGSLVKAQEPNVAVSVSVPVHNAIRISEPELEFYFETGRSEGNSTTTLEFATNDGRSHSIFVTAKSAWAFTPAVPGIEPAQFPVLQVTGATSTAGLPATSSATVIGGDNTVRGVIEVVRGIASATGTAQVFFEADGDGVIAGTYQTSLSFTMAAP